MTPFWFLVGGLGAMWFITSGRARAVLDALTGAIATPTGAIPTYDDPTIQSGGGFGGGQQQGSPPPQQPPFSGGAYNLDAPPSLTAAQIDAILAAGHSPATGLGNRLIELGQQYGIDPAYALAFFKHETSLGTDYGANAGTNQWGNIRCTPGWSGPCHNGWRVYPSFAASAEDWFRLIRQEYIDGRNLHNLADILPIYAPPFENDTPGYIRQVQLLIQQWTGRGQGA